MVRQAKLFWPLMLGIALLLAACGRGSGESGSRWLDLLRYVPDTEDTRFMVTVNDYAKAREVFALQTPASGLDDQSIWDYWESLIGDCQHDTGLAPAQYTGLTTDCGSSQYSNTAGPIFMARTWQQALGYSFLDVDRDLWAGRGSRIYEAVRWRIDREAIREVVSGQPDDRHSLESHRGVQYYSWCEDDVPGCGPGGDAPELRRPRRLALRGQTALWAPWTEGIRGMIDATLNKTRSLADSREYRLLARGLGGLNTYTAFFSYETQGYQRMEDYYANSFPIPENPREYYRQLLDVQPRLLPYTAFATGLGKDLEGFYVGVGLAHRDQKTAEANVARLKDRLERGTSLQTERPWNETFPRSQVWSEGRLLLAKLYFSGKAIEDDLYGNSSIGLWQGFFWLADPLLLHE